MNMFDASVLPMLQALGAASAMLAKAAAHAEAQKYDPAILVQARLAPSQFTTAKQIQVMSDFCKTGGARLAGVDSPRMADTEVTFADLQATTVTLNGGPGNDALIYNGAGSVTLNGDGVSSPAARAAMVWAFDRFGQSGK